MLDKTPPLCYITCRHRKSIIASKRCLRKKRRMPTLYTPTETMMNLMKEIHTLRENGLNLKQISQIKRLSHGYVRYLHSCYVKYHMGGES